MTELPDIKITDCQYFCEACGDFQQCEIESPFERCGARIVEINCPECEGHITDLVVRADRECSVSSDLKGEVKR